MQYISRCDSTITLRGTVTGGASFALASSNLGSGMAAGMPGSALLSQSDCAAPGATLIWVALMLAWAAFSWRGLSLMYVTTMSFVAPGGMWPMEGLNVTGATSGNSNLQHVRNSRHSLLQFDHSCATHSPVIAVPMVPLNRHISQQQLTE